MSLKGQLYTAGPLFKGIPLDSEEVLNMERNRTDKAYDIACFNSFVYMLITKT